MREPHPMHSHKYQNLLLRLDATHDIYEKSYSFNVSSHSDVLVTHTERLRSDGDKLDSGFHKLEKRPNVCLKKYQNMNNFGVRCSDAASQMM